MILKVLFENKQILVVNKPAGLVVNRADSVRAPTVQDWADQRLKIQDFECKSGDETIKIFRQRSGIAHRLDKDTSGCLLLAKEPESLQDLLRQFRERQVKKTYLALVHGRIEPGQGTWKLPLSRKANDRSRFAVDPFGKEAETAYIVREYVGGCTLLHLFPRTGRTHQIRVHCAHMKHPIVADERYLKPKQLGLDKRWCPRQFLHAQSISFKLPDRAELVTVEAEVPEDLERALGYLHDQN